MKSDTLPPHSVRLQLYFYIGFILFYFCKSCLAADLAIQIPGNLGRDGSFYRLDYTPPHGKPLPNTTLRSRDIGDVIKFSEGLPGTKYEFWLYYSNSSVVDLLTWTASITTAPDPPTNLSVQVHGGKSAQISWSPPAQGQYSHFKMKVVPLSDVPPPNSPTLEEELGLQYSLQNLTPGASYQVQLFTVYDDKESVAYISRNFTTKPNTPGKFIVWFRNETTLLVLWQPPYPAGIFANYRVSIEPQDSPESNLLVDKEGEPPGPAQAAFKGLTPGRAYNISVQTASDDELSAPTTAQYRTVPLRPMNVTFDRNSITSHSFKVQWEPPKGISEFDKYQILIGLRRPTPVSRLRSEPTTWEFKENLDPGRTYQVVVKTVSGKVTSWPATGNVTLKPLPVTNLRGITDERTGLIKISWTPDNSSFQENYKITTHEVEASYSGDINTVYTDNLSAILEQLLPGRNYSITVQAVSNQMESNETTIYMATRPLSPIIEDLRPIPRGLNISWKSDVKTRQEKFEVIYSRNDTGENVTTVTTESRLVLPDLYPGAGYDVKVFAISHGLRSEPHEDFQAVYPYPPRNLTIEKVTSNSVLVRWEPPVDSIFSEYSIRFRTEENSTWIKLPPVKVNEAEVTDMTPGEKYVIQVNTVSFGVESNIPQEVNHTIRPNPVSNIALLVDSNNVTLEWPRPEGRIENYLVQWQAEDETEVHTKNITETTSETEGRQVRVLIGDLMPGVNYTFQIHTVSYGLESDIIVLSERTSESRKYSLRSGKTVNLLLLDGVLKH